ncbi:Arv1-domain-containing protein [Pluteus cervinus]|uniref:Arv1-domain-containing protein n=1 Tax=Pluteus cervinus TaxID=181527 RepID=A0ACD3B556_9AGAR|nr:Arv1-domain-containing protein [Pluteus cervinus]
MPICVSCTSFLPYLYTVYQSEHNLRLEQCPKCYAFADPYVEHDDLILILDLILFKRGVYRHLLYNRGTPPFYAERKNVNNGVNVKDEVKPRIQSQWARILRIGSMLVLVDAFIRWSHINPAQPHEVSPWTQTNLVSFTRVLLACIAETIAFHGGIIVACYIVSSILTKILPSRQKGHPLSPKVHFKFSLIPLALFYSSLTKLFLLFSLTIWRPTSAPATSAHAQSVVIWDNPLFMRIVQNLERDNISREWMIRNALGGMSAGFGLRVILDCHPLLTTLIIVTGWAVKTSVNNLLSKWVGGDTGLGDAWLAYSIP